MDDVVPIIECFRALRNRHNDIINRNTMLSLVHETNWLPLARIHLPISLISSKLCKYDAMLEGAKKQEAAHMEILQSIEVSSAYP